MFASSPDRSFAPPPAAGYGRPDPALLAELHDPAGEGAPLTYAYDDRLGIIRAFSHGGWTVAQVDDHHAALERMVALLRRHDPCVKVLFDLRKGDNLSKEASQRMGAGLRRLYGPQDRVALIIPSSLFKAKVREAVPGPQFSTFVSTSAAETWLCAYDAPRAASGAAAG